MLRKDLKLENFRIAKASIRFYKHFNNLNQLIPKFFAFLENGEKILVDKIFNLENVFYRNEFDSLKINTLALSKIKYFKLELNSPEISFVIYFKLSNRTIECTSLFTNKLFEEDALEEITKVKNRKQHNSLHYGLYFLPTTAKFIVFYFLLKENEIIDVSKVFNSIEIPGLSELKFDKNLKDSFTKKEMWLSDEEVKLYTNLQNKFISSLKKEGISLNELNTINNYLIGFNYLNIFDFRTAYYLYTYVENLDFLTLQFLIQKFAKVDFEKNLEKKVIREGFVPLESNKFLYVNESSAEMYKRLDHIESFSTTEIEENDFDNWDSVSILSIRFSDYAREVISSYTKVLDSLGYAYQYSSFDFNPIDNVFAYKNDGWIL